MHAQFYSVKSRAALWQSVCTAIVRMRMPSFFWETEAAVVPRMLPHLTMSAGSKSTVQVGAPSCGDAADVRSRSDDIATNRKVKLLAGNLALA